MKTLKQVTISILFSVLAWLSTAGLYAQVTVGDGDPAQNFSVLEISTKNVEGGLRLPQLNTSQRDAISSDASFMGAKAEQGKGLVIYNLSTNCIEYWNSKKWVSLCTGTADISFVDSGNNPVDPTQPSFPSIGGDKGPFTPVDNPNCTDENPAFDFLLVTGADYTNINIINASTGEFNISMNANLTAKTRTAVLRITNNCTKEYKEFLFTQEGDDADCGTTIVPDIKSYDATHICQEGTANLYLDGNPTAGTFIWTLNGKEVGRGATLSVSEPGRYIVYGDKIACSNNKSIVITQGSNSAPASVNFIVVGNNGVACGSGGTVELIVTDVASGTIVWYKNGQRTSKTGSHIQADKGKWFAVVEDGACVSMPTASIDVVENLDGGSVPTPVMKINGVTSGWGLCKGGSMYLEVDNPQVGIAYTWYINNDEIGTGTGLYKLVPAADNFVIRLRASGTGCAQEAFAIENLSGTTAPGVPLISVNTGDVLCGGKATLTSSNPGGATSYRWFKNGVEITGNTTNTIEVTEAATYTVSAIAGTCASIQSGGKTIKASDFATLSWINHPATANLGEIKTYSVNLQYPDAPAGALYTWTVTGATITNGQGTSSITVQMPSSAGTVSVSCTAQNGCGNAIGSPLSETVTVSPGCTEAQITNTSSLNTAIKVNNSAVLSVTALGTDITYQWYSGTVGSGSAISGATNSTYTYNATTATGSPFLFYCIVTAGGACASSPATSGQFSVTVNKDPADILTGAGMFSGKTCFDIAYSNDNTNSCTPLSTRVNQKTSFSNRSVQDPATGHITPYSGVQVYTFKPIGTVSKVRFDYIDAGGKVIKSLTPQADYSNQTNISGECKVTVEFKESLDNELRGLTRSTALKAELYAIYNSNAAGTGTEQKLKLNLTLQDCACCGAKTLSGGWLTFMCHNLGADESLDPFVYKSDGNTVDADIKGYLYQWGRPSDGHQKRTSATTTVLATNNQATAPADVVGKFITTTASPFDWRSGGGNTSRWGDGTAGENQKKAANDPCPDGWKVPSQKQWQSIYKASGDGTQSAATANTWSWTGNGYKIGEALYLPAAGMRRYNDFLLLDVGNFGYYWSSSTVGTTIYSYHLNFGNSNVNPASNRNRSTGGSVRCVVE